MSENLSSAKRDMLENDTAAERKTTASATASPPGTANPEAPLPQSFNVSSPAGFPLVVPTAHSFQYSMPIDRGSGNFMAIPVYSLFPGSNIDPRQFMALPLSFLNFSPSQLLQTQNQMNIQNQNNLQGHNVHRNNVNNTSAPADNTSAELPPTDGALKSDNADNGHDNNNLNDISSDGNEDNNTSGPDEKKQRKRRRRPYQKNKKSDCVHCLEAERPSCGLFANKCPSRPCPVCEKRHRFKRCKRLDLDAVGYATFEEALAHVEEIRKRRRISEETPKEGTSTSLNQHHIQTRQRQSKNLTL